MHCSQYGGVGGWDLRMGREAVRLPIRPEFGYSTCMITASCYRGGGASGTEGKWGGSGNGNGGQWVMVGTSRGYLLLWDLRFNLLCGAWKHSAGSPIYLMETGFSYQTPGHISTPLASGPGSTGIEGSEGVEERRGSSRFDTGVGDDEETRRPGQGPTSVLLEYVLISAGDNEVALWSLPLSDRSKQVIQWVDETLSIIYNFHAKLAYNNIE